MPGTVEPADTAVASYPAAFLLESLVGEDLTIADLATGVELHDYEPSTPDIESYLFGRLLLAGQTDFVLSAAWGAVVATAVIALWRPLLLYSRSGRNAPASKGCRRAR